MPLGPDVPEWAELRRVLTELATDVKAHFAYVFDSRANLWCTSEDSGYQSRATEIVQSELATLRKPLHRGGQLDRFAVRHAGHAYLKSFGGIYVLLLRFSGPRSLETVREAVGLALPRIGSLVARLPPPDGPGSEGAEGVTVA